MGKAVVVAMQPAIERVKKLADGTAKPAARPDLPRAFGARRQGRAAAGRVRAGRGDAQVDRGELPKLPGELGGGDTKQVSRGVLFAGSA